MPNNSKLFYYTVKALTDDSDFRRWVCATASRCASGGGGSITTVNGQSPDSSGNVVSNLQSTTDGTGNNKTSNVIQLTGTDNVDISINSAIFAFTGTSLEIDVLFDNGTKGSSLVLTENGLAVNAAEANLTIDKTAETKFVFSNGVTNILEPISIGDGILPTHAVTKQQEDARIIEDTSLVFPDTPVTQAQLNTAFPNAPTHQIVYAHNVGSGMMFMKRNDNQWVYWTAGLVDS